MSTTFDSHVPTWSFDGVNKGARTFKLSHASLLCCSPFFFLKRYFIFCSGREIQFFFPVHVPLLCETRKTRTRRGNERYKFGIPTCARNPVKMDFQACVSVCAPLGLLLVLTKSVGDGLADEPSSNSRSISGNFFANRIGNALFGDALKQYSRNRAGKSRIHFCRNRSTLRRRSSGPYTSTDPRCVWGVISMPIVKRGGGGFERFAVEGVADIRGVLGRFEAARRRQNRSGRTVQG